MRYMQLSQGMLRSQRRGLKAEVVCRVWVRDCQSAFGARGHDLCVATCGLQIGATPVAKKSTRQHIERSNRNRKRASVEDGETLGNYSKLMFPVYLLFLAGGQTKLMYSTMSVNKPNHKGAPTKIQPRYKDDVYGGRTRRSTDRWTRNIYQDTVGFGKTLTRSEGSETQPRNPAARW